MCYLCSTPMRVVNTTHKVWGCVPFLAQAGSRSAAALDRYTMFGSGGIRLGVNRARQVGVRRMGGWIRTNMRTEENAGLREASYKTWEFDTTSVPRLLVYMFIPGALFFFVARDEMVSGHAS